MYTSSVLNNYELDICEPSHVTDGTMTIYYIRSLIPGLNPITKSILNIVKNLIHNIKISQKSKSVGRYLKPVKTKPKKKQRNRYSISIKYEYRYSKLKHLPK